MKLIDTHNHLYLEDFDPEQDQLVTIAKESGIDTLLLPNVDTSTIRRMHDLCDRHPDFAYPMMGLHPTSVDEHYAKNLKETESWLGRRVYCGIGEIGIDLYWDKTYLKEQKEVFEEQLRWSIQKIVLETDAPYLAPVPYRGKRNEPAYIWKTAEKVAQTYGLTLEETVETTRINALKLFKIENKPIS